MYIVCHPEKARLANMYIYILYVPRSLKNCIKFTFKKEREKKTKKRVIESIANGQSDLFPPAFSNISLFDNEHK